MKKINVILSILFLAFSMACTAPPEAYKEHRLEVLLRDIGHNLLLSAHDSISRVLPVQKISPQVYQLSFEAEFAFSPDTLVRLVNAKLGTEYPLNEYIVRVFDCSLQVVFYAFENQLKQPDNTPCSGRAQPKGCYRIHVEFLPKSTHKDWLFGIGALAILALAAGIFYQKKRRQQHAGLVSVGPHITGISVGQFTFYPEKNSLYLPGSTIPLSEKETRLLNIFAQNPNQTVERDTLMQHIWGDEGVLVISRNLDVLVSKLRKKLQADPKLKIVNVHAKGYKLEIE
jgi:hypothetical protein